MKVKINYLLTIPLLIGVIGFLAQAIIVVFGIHLNCELPITNVQQVVETNDKIYVGNTHYSVIQVFDKSGNHLFNHGTNTYGKSFGFSISEEGKYSITPPNNLSLLESVIPKQDLMQLESILGNKYKTTNFPIRLYYASPMGNRELLEQPLYMNFIGGPVYFWTIGAISMFLLFAFNMTQVLDVFNTEKNRRNMIRELEKVLYR